MKYEFLDNMVGFKMIKDTCTVCIISDISDISDLRGQLNYKYEMKNLLQKKKSLLH
jgi:hypothetical protein